MGILGCPVGNNLNIHGHPLNRDICDIGAIIDRREDKKMGSTSEDVGWFWRSDKCRKSTPALRRREENNLEDTFEDSIQQYASIVIL